jgi:[citrate (pro-3S)-lyase] ligase
MYGLEIQEVNLKDKSEREEVEKFLNKNNLSLDSDVDYTLAVKVDGIIKATCSKSKNTLKCFAVDSELRGEGIASTLVTRLIDKQFQQGIYHSFVFTKPENIDIFASLNFKLISKVSGAALLESGIYDINSYLDKLIRTHNLSNNNKAALVMNCNPFTLGHKYLIEKAASENTEVLVFIVEENKSLFPFEVRYNLVKEGTKNLENVKVIPGGEYIISSATFPAYFLREESSRLKAYTELDASIFGEYFCKKLNINRRYVGNEPYCNVTNQYNEALREVLERYSVELKVVERMKQMDYVISASKVRELIKENDFQQLTHILPQTTINFLLSDTGKAISEKIKSSNSPH